MARQALGLAFFFLALVGWAPALAPAGPLKPAAPPPMSDDDDIFALSPALVDDLLRELAPMGDLGDMPGSPGAGMALPPGYLDGLPPYTDEDHSLAPYPLDDDFDIPPMVPFPEEDYETDLAELRSFLSPGPSPSSATKLTSAFAATIAAAGFFLL